MHEEIQALTTIVESTTDDLALSGWLAEKRSERTRIEYADTVAAFRAALQHQGLDLLRVEDQNERRALGLIAQQFVIWSKKGKQVAAATINQRLAILSSFYGYAKRHELTEHNPIERIKRAKVQAYAGAQPLGTHETHAGLQTIDRSTREGARDYALLAILLQTGRRLSEVQALTWANVKVNQGRVTLTFEHCKGDKMMVDTLAKPTGEALLSWLHMYYGGFLSQLAPSAPLWVSLARGSSRDKQLGIGSIANICKKYLHTSKVHATRHTFAHTMEAAGASVSEIQSRLGHESLATTGRYLAQLKQAENRHAETIASMLGIE